MSPLERRPAGVRVQATMDGLHIQLPLRSQLAAPRQSLHRAPLSARIGPSAAIFAVALLLTAPPPLVLAQMGRLDAEPIALAVCVLVAGLATLVANLVDVSVKVRGVDRYPAAQVRLEHHQLTLTVEGRDPTVVRLDDIELVTVDSAGARMRVCGQTVPLLPARSVAERAWLGAVLADVVERRAAGTDDAAGAADAMRRMIEQRSL